MLPLQCWLYSGMFCPGLHFHPGVCVCVWLSSQVRGLFQNFTCPPEWVEVLWTRISGKDGIRIMVMVGVARCDDCWLCSPGWLASASVLVCATQWIHFARTGWIVVGVSRVCHVETCVSKLARTFELGAQILRPFVLQSWNIQNVNGRM
jgi:hypothetical protein